jgi:uncharacterized protein YdaU (DUF1376 family)
MRNDILPFPSIARQPATEGLPPNNRATHVPFYPSDWLAGVAGMTPAQIGVYITVLMLIYDAGGPIFFDKRRLARRMCCPQNTFTTIIEDLIADGKVTLNDGFLSNARAEIELKKLGQKRLLASESAKTRWQEKPSKTTVADMPTHSERNANQSQSHNHSKKLKQKEDLEPGISEAVKVWNEMAKANDLPVCMKAVGKRAVQLQARLKEIGLDGWKALVASIPSQPFLVGKAGERPFKADIDFLVTDSSFTKILEGRYTTDRKPIDLNQSKPKEIDQLKAARTYIRQMDVYGDKFWDHRWTEYCGLTEAQARSLVSKAEQEQTSLALPNQNFGAH